MLRIFILLHRLGQLFTRVNFIYRIYGMVYKLILRILYSMDFPLEVRFGSDLRIFHYYGIVLHKKVILGNNVTIRHGVTIGERKGGVPKIDDNVDIGVGAIVLGNIIVGRGAKVGAGAIVLHDVEPNQTIIGVHVQE